MRINERDGEDGRRFVVYWDLSDPRVFQIGEATFFVPDNESTPAGESFNWDESLALLGYAED